MKEKSHYPTVVDQKMRSLAKKKLKEDVQDLEKKKSSKKASQTAAANG